MKEEEATARLICVIPTRLLDLMCLPACSSQCPAKHHAV